MSDLPHRARAVIVGAGISGASLAYHLAREGWEDVVVLDRGVPASTAHAPGLMFQGNPSRTMTRLAGWSVELYSALGCFERVGGIEVATTKERWEELERRWGRAAGYGLEAELLDAGGVAERIPLVDPERILGGLLVPSDGIGRAVAAAEALLAGRPASAASPPARSDGTGRVRSITDCAVTGFAIEAGRVRGVRTSRGAIAAETVVLACGIWGPQVARLAGVRVPLVAVQHQYARTAALPELAGETREVVHPILRHQDHSVYFRQHTDTYGIGNYRHEPLLVEDVGPSSLLPFTPDDFAGAGAEAGRLLPDLAGAEIVDSFNGLMSFTPDGMPLLGPVAAVRGLWLAEAIWVTHAGGAGRALAELMTNGDASVDLHECDPQRFDGHGLSRAYARARGAQQYREVYDIVHPRQQTLQARPLRTTPFHRRQVELGAEFFESAGWERPQWYEANRALVDERAPHPSAWSARHWSPIVAAEHLACRERVGIFDLTPFTKVEISGPPALAYLQRIAANDVDRPVGTIVYTAMLNARGGIMCDLTITRLADDAFLVVTGGAVGRHDLAWMRRHLPEDGSVRLDDRSSALCCVGVWGPRARDLVASVCEDDLSFPYMRACEIDVGCVPARALRISYVGEAGWEIYAPTEFGAALWDALWEAGASVGAAACGGGAYDSLRLEKGYRLWGADIDEEHDPWEAGLGWAVRLDKGEFLGRDAALRARKAGPARRLCCLVAADPGTNLVGAEPILDGSRAIGYVTSAAWGASVEQSILYGYLPSAYADPGTALSVYADGRRHAVTVAREPLFDPENARLRDQPRSSTRSSASSMRRISSSAR